MQSAWIRHLKSDVEKERFTNSVVGSKPVLQRLAAIISELESETDRTLSSANSYDSPNWALKAADRNGYTRALSTIKQLINLDQQKE